MARTSVPTVPPQPRRARHLAVAIPVALLLVLALALGARAAASQPGGAGAEGTATAHGSSDEADGLRRLAERLVGVWGDPGTLRVELLVGTLPAEVDVPVPNLDLLGSVARFERDELVSMNAVFDGPTSTMEGLGRLRAAFEADGWTVVVDDPTIGFVGTQVGFFGRACGPAAEAGGDRPLVYFSIAPVTGRPSDIRMDYSPVGWDGACVPMDAHAATFAPLPTLTAPEGATVVSPVMSHAPDEATAVATVRGAGELVVVAEHYEALMAAAGWQRAEEGERDAARVRSVWTREAIGRTWVAVLALERPVLAGPVVATLAIVPADGP